MSKIKITLAIETEAQLATAQQMVQSAIEFQMQEIREAAKGTDLAALASIADGLDFLRRVQEQVGVANLPKKRRKRVAPGVRAAAEEQVRLQTVCRRPGCGANLGEPCIAIGGENKGQPVNYSHKVRYEDAGMTWEK